MIDLKLNDSHDLEMVNGDFVFRGDGATVAQNFKIRFLTRLGEWHQNPMQFGLDWDVIYAANVPMELKTSFLREMVLEDPDVESIIRMDIYKNEREMRLLVDLAVKTIYSNTPEIIELVL